MYRWSLGRLTVITATTGRVATRDSKDQPSETVFSNLLSENYLGRFSVAKLCWSGMLSQSCARPRSSSAWELDGTRGVKAGTRFR